MHDRAVVVLHKVESAELVELRPISGSYVFPVNLNIIVSVASHLLVPHSQAVPDLVNWNSELHNMRTNQPALC